MNKKNKPMISVIIPTYNRPEKLFRCVDSILKDNYSKLELIIIIDGEGTNYGDLEMFSNKIKIIKVINGKRKGLAFSRNRGISLANGEFILFIDDDNIVGSNMIYHLANTLTNDQSYGIVSPLTLYYSDKKSIWFAGAKMNHYTSKFNFFYKNSCYTDLQLKKIFKSDVVHNCFMTKKKLFKQIGSFDEELFVSGTELDLCFRLKSKYLIGINSDAKCFHDIPKEKSSNILRVLGFIDNKRVYYAARNRLVIMKRYVNNKNLFTFILLFLPILTIRNLLLFLIYRKNQFLINYLRGLISGLKYLITNQLANN